MNEMTAGKAAEALEKIKSEMRAPCVHHICKSCINDCKSVTPLTFAASVLRRVASGELAEVKHNEKDDSQQLCKENENFIQNKFGYCFYSLGPCPLVYNLYVLPEYRRCSHSKRLLELVISEIRKNGYDGKIYIQAVPREDSIGVEELIQYYKSMGLTVMKEREHHA